MESLTLTALDLLGRDPAPALSVERLSTLLARMDPGEEADGARILEGLADGSGRLHLLLRPKRRWCEPSEPRAWILAAHQPRMDSPPLRPLVARMRITLRHLGGTPPPHGRPRGRGRGGGDVRQNVKT
jgi:hypothetical protein